MTTESIDPLRRRILIAALAATARGRIAPSIVSSEAHAATLLRLAEEDPAAEALKYQMDAAEAPGVYKAGTPAEKQFCYNCRHTQPKMVIGDRADYLQPKQSVQTAVAQPG